MLKPLKGLEKGRKTVKPKAGVKTQALWLPVSVQPMLKEQYAQNCFESKEDALKILEIIV